MTVAILGSPTRTNVFLAYAWRRRGVDAHVLWPQEALDALGPGDTVLVRLDVLPTLDGIEPGLDLVPALERNGVRVLNRPEALYATHDKLMTASVLSAAGVPHPWTEHVEPRQAIPVLPFPCVLKPRFGSWGKDVFLCETIEDLARTLDRIAERPWWNRHGAIAQELIGRKRLDVRVLVAGGRVVAGAERVAAPDEWRTNVTLGGMVVKAGLPPGTGELAVRTAEAVGIDFAGVDLLPQGDNWVVLELNGAVDFDTNYVLPGTDPLTAMADALGITPRDSRAARDRITLTSLERMEAPMTKTVQGKPAKKGDEVVITGHSVGDSSRTAVILEVLGPPGREHFRVRWEDGHESIFFPGEDAVIRRPKPRRHAKSPA